MKRLLMLAVIAALALPVSAWAQTRDADKGAAKDVPKDAPKKDDGIKGEVRLKPALPGPEKKELLPAPKQGGLTGDDALEEGVSLFKAGRYPDSADVLSTAVGSMPNFPRASLLLANAQFAIGNFEAAGEELSRGLQLSQSVNKEITEIKEIWRDYVLLKQRIDGLGRLVEAEPEDLSLRLLYGFYYGIAGYREYTNRVLRSIPSDSDDGPAVATLLRSKFPKKPWVDLPPPSFQPQTVGARRPFKAPPGAPYPPPPPPAFDISRHLNIGFGFGGNVINGQLKSQDTRAATEGFGSGRFFVGFLVDRLEVDFNFGWQSLHGDIWLPNMGFGQNVTLNIYSMGLQVAWHILQKAKRAKGFDPSVRLGYSFYEMEAGDWYYYGDYYYSGTTAAVGHGPMAGLTLDYIFIFVPLDITLGLDVFYEAMILRDDGGNPLDGGSLNVHGKVGFRF